MSDALAYNGFGSVAWGVRTGGRLSPRDRFRLVLQGIGALLREQSSRRLRALGFGPTPRRLIDQVPYPSSCLTSRVEDLAGAANPEWLQAHCLRSYAFGALFAVRDGLRYDTELLYVSALLHDLGATEAHAAPPGACFALHGAAVARQMLEREGLRAERAARAAEAIALHLNISVPLGTGVEAHLLRRGSGCDVFGEGLPLLAREDVREVVRRHPRGDSSRKLAEVIEAQSARSPCTRIAFLCRGLKLAERARGLRVEPSAA